MGRDDRRHLRSEIWRESITDEVSEELSFHVEMRARELAAELAALAPILDPRRGGGQRGDALDLEAGVERREVPVGGCELSRDPVGGRDRAGLADRDVEP